MKILAIGAHPDDLEILMGGTIAAFQAQGDEVVMVMATDGARGGTIDPKVLVRIRRREARAGAAVFGLEPLMLDFPDGGLRADTPVIDRLAALIRDERPQLIITHAPNDYHGDHRALSDAVRIAANFVAPVMWMETILGVGFAPTHYIDITPYFAKKMRSIRKHKSQDPERFVEMADLSGRFRSAQCNATAGYAEVFRFEPIYPFPDIRNLLPPAPGISRVKDRGAAAAGKRGGR
jgi:LmbE family N-acetylglucosaminyl deacetylase